MLKATFSKFARNIAYTLRHLVQLMIGQRLAMLLHQTLIKIQRLKAL
jgi:hypothetical protein